MNPLIESVELWMQALMVLSWKGTLLALAVGLVLLVLHRHLSPAWRHGLWLLVLLRFMVPDLGAFSFSLDVLADIPVLREAEPATVAEEAAAVEMPAVEEVPASVAEPLPEMTGVVGRTMQPAAPVMTIPSWSLKQKLSLLWLCGTVAVFSVMVALHLRLQRRIRKDASEAFSEVSAILEEACRLAQVRHVPRLMVTDAVRAPSLFGILRPVILLPRQVAAGKDTAALKLILLHELAHLKRHDLWAQILASCMIALHWFNPMVWIAARRMRAEAEMAADAHALRCTDATEAHRFGAMLLGFAQHATAGWMLWFASATLLGISENKNDLRRRIEGLMDIARGRRTRWVIGMGAFLVLAVIGLTRSPAEETKKPATQQTVKAAHDSATTTVTGIVVDQQGKPVKGAQVRLSINMFSASDYKEQRTGEDGKFAFEEVPKSASLNVRANHSDYAESNFIVFQGVSESVERRLVLPKISWIVGKITDKATGRPVKDASVFYGLENKVTFVSRFEWKHPFARTNDAGEFRLGVKAPEAKEIIIRAWAPDMGVQSKVLKLTEVETTFDAALEPVARIPGKVVNFEGEAVKEAMVWVVEDAVKIDESFKPITPETMRSGERVRLTFGNFFIGLDYSKEDGAVSVPEVEPLLKDKLWVVAMHPKAGFARMRARDLKAGAVFKLERWASMRGRILRQDGSPVAGATVLINAKGEPDGLPSPETLKITHSISFVTDKDGGYKISHLLPGATFSGVSLSGVAIKKEYLPLTTVTVGSGPQSERQITLGTSLRQTRAGGVRPVQGRIVLPEGHAFRTDDYSIHFSIISNGVPIPGLLLPDPSGRFMTEPLPPGRYELSASVLPRKSGMELPRNAGRWMRFEVKAGDEPSPLRLEDIVLEKAELTPTPRSESSASGSQPPVYVEGPNGKAEVTTMDADKKPVAGVKVEILDFVDHARAPLGLAESFGKGSNYISDANGRVTISFPRVPAAGRRACGVQVIGIAPDGAKSRKTELMDGRKHELRVYPETPVHLTISNPIVRWSASGSGGLIAENQPLEGGEVRTKLALDYSGYFLLQGTTAEGKVLFSNALGAGPGHNREITKAVTLAPGVEIEGKIEGLPTGYDGSGGVVARVYVKSEGEVNQIARGYPPSIPWKVWAPVERDGRFHFTGMPRGMASLIGMGKGWMTRGSLESLTVESAILINLSGPSEKVTATLSTKPCMETSVRVLAPDGNPLAGAEVQFGLREIQWKTPAQGELFAEDGEKYEKFNKQPWNATQARTDDEGRFILVNRPTGKIFCQVFWADPKTQHSRWGTGYITLQDQESKTPVEVQVTEK